VRVLAIRLAKLACLSLLALAGCEPLDGDALTIATTWPADARAEVEDALHARGSQRVRWVLLAPGDDVARVAGRRQPPDLILGGSSSTYEKLDARGLLAPTSDGGPGWVVMSRAPLDINANSRPSPGGRPDFTFNDPRRDPVALAWAKVELKLHGWTGGYARLVQSACGSIPPGRQPGSALAAVERGEAGATPAIGPRERMEKGQSVVDFGLDVSPEWFECAAAVRGARHAGAAATLLRKIADPGRVEPPQSSLGADALLADLLGATLVEARDELIAARGVLKGLPPTERYEAGMTEAPPWPPASIAKILERTSNAMPLLETLAAQVAPDADVRAWLLRSWLAPGRPVDGRLLDELASAEGGRLVREPRFRAWLRAEWTAWARQRYRRIARVAALGTNPGGPSS
jgi:hypothetical protein